MSDSRVDHNINKKEWDDPFSRQLRKFLLTLLQEFLRVAIEKIVDLGLGYTKETAELLILRSGLYHGFKDVTSNAVEGAMAFVRDGKQPGPLIFNDLGKLLEYCLIELVHVLRHRKPCASVPEAMWCLLLCDLNFWHAVSVSSDQLGLVSINDISGDTSSALSEENNLNEDFKQAYYSQHFSKLVDFKNPVSRELPSPSMNNFCACSVSREESPLPPFLKSGDTGSLLSVADDKVPVSLSLNTKYIAKKEVNNDGQSSMVPNYFHVMHNNESVGTCIPKDDKEETIVGLSSRMTILQNEINRWTDWANEKVMQATRRLGKERSEMQMLMKRKEAAAILNQTIEESTRNRLSEMTHALSDVTDRTNTAYSAVRKLQNNNSVLKAELVSAKIKADRSVHELHEASKEVEEALEKIRSTELLKVPLQEEFAALRHCNSDLLSQLKIARGREVQHEVIRKREEAEKLKYHEDAIRKRRETERLKAETKEKEDKMREEIESLKRRSLSSESPSLQVVSGGGTGGFSSSSIENLKTSSSRYIEAAKRLMTRFEADRMTAERECVICFTEEASVTLLPCAHMVLCSQCSVIHEEQGMSDCPSCRKRIMMRMAVRSAHD